MATRGLGLLQGGGPDRGGTVPPPTGTTLSSTHADDVCEHLPISRSGAGRFFASTPPASGFVCDYAIGAARQRGPSKRVCKPPVTLLENRVVPRALGSARWPASLLRVCVYRPSHIHSAIRTRKRTVRCVSLPAWICASRYVDVATCRLLARPAVRPTPTFGYGAVSKRCSKIGGVADDSRHPLARSRVDFRSLLA
jgi:hypothetical protein